jgi:hypothetical protein
VSLQPADFPPLGGARAPPVPTGVWTSGAGKAREPVGAIHRDGSIGPTATGGGGEGVERTASKGPGPRVPRIVSVPPPASAPVPGQNAFVHELTDGVNALTLDGQS